MKPQFFVLECYSDRNPVVLGEFSLYTDAKDAARQKAGDNMLTYLVVKTQFLVRSRPVEDEKVAP